MTTPTVAKRPGPSTGLSVTLLVVGVAVLIGGVIFAIVSIVRDITDAPVIQSPGESIHLGTGKYLVYEESGFSTIEGTSIRVTGPTPGGSNVPVEPYDGGTRQTLTRGGSTFVARLQFHTDTAGDYDIRLTGSDRVVVGRSILDTFKKSIPGWIIAFVGFAIGLTGTIMWIVGASRRRRARQMYYAGGSGPGPGVGPGPVPGAGGPPAGWYPDPQVSGRQRYWDGSVWTDHYA